MNVGLWVLVGLVAANGVVVVLAVIAGRRGGWHAPPPGSPRARFLASRDRWTDDA